MLTKLFLLTAVFSAPLAAGQPITNVHVYSEPGRYGGWPANHGIWGGGNEIVVGFTEATFAVQANGEAIDGKALFYDRQARSTPTYEPAPAGFAPFILSWGVGGVSSLPGTWPGTEVSGK